jgi:hypothetical protein
MLNVTGSSATGSNATGSSATDSCATSTEIITINLDAEPAN